MSLTTLTLFLLPLSVVELAAEINHEDQGLCIKAGDDCHQKASDKCSKLQDSKESSCESDLRCFVKQLREEGLCCLKISCARKLDHVDAILPFSSFRLDDGTLQFELL
jgi:hypothetical protein